MSEAKLLTREELLAKADVVSRWREAGDITAAALADTLWHLAALFPFDESAASLAGERDQWKANYSAAIARAEAAEKRVAELERARDDWKARHDQVFAEADRKIASLRNVSDEARAESAAMVGTLRCLVAVIDRDGGQTQEREHVLVSAARAQSQVSAMLVDVDTLRRGAAQLEAALADYTSRLEQARLAGIREGLERAAALCDREAEACRGHQRALEAEPRAGKVPSAAMHECAANQNAACAHYIRAMKEQVK